jgi:hypothetical protein
MTSFHARRGYTINHLRCIEREFFPSPIYLYQETVPSLIAGFNSDRRLQLALLDFQTIPEEFSKVNSISTKWRCDMRHNATTLGFRSFKVESLCNSSSDDSLANCFESLSDRIRRRRPGFKARPPSSPPGMPPPLPAARLARWPREIEAGTDEMKMKLVGCRGGAEV